MDFGSFSEYLSFRFGDGRASCRSVVKLFSSMHGDGETQADNDGYFTGNLKSLIHHWFQAGLTKLLWLEPKEKFGVSCS